MDSLVWSPWRPIHERLGRILASWRFTPYMKGQRCKGVGVDCVRFVSAIVDELRGCSRAIKCPWPQDGGWHNREGAMRIARFLVQAYEPVVRIREPEVQPADVLVLGPHGGGPAHVMIVGPQPNELWHSDQGLGVQRSGFRSDLKVFRVYRAGDRDTWLSSQ